MERPLLASEGIVLASKILLLPGTAVARSRPRPPRSRQTAVQSVLGCDILIERPITAIIAITAIAASVALPQPHHALPSAYSSYLGSLPAYSPAIVASLSLFVLPRVTSWQHFNLSHSSCEPTRRHRYLPTVLFLRNNTSHCTTASHNMSNHEIYNYIPILKIIFVLPNTNSKMTSFFNRHSCCCTAARRFHLRHGSFCTQIIKQTNQLGVIHKFAPRHQNQHNPPTGQTVFSHRQYTQHPALLYSTQQRPGRRNPRWLRCRSQACPRLRPV